MTTRYKNKASGNIYKQICISNATATRPNWPMTMVYQDVKTGEIWSRKLDNFLEVNVELVEVPEVQGVVRRYFRGLCVE